MRNRQIDQIHVEARLLEMVRETEGELPGVASFLAPLEKLHAQAVSSRDQREKLAASAREATKQLHENLAAANDAAIALRSYIKGVLGFRNPKLARYRMKPRRKRGCPRKHLATCGQPS